MSFYSDNLEPSTDLYLIERKEFLAFTFWKNQEQQQFKISDDAFECLEPKLVSREIR